MQHRLDPATGGRRVAGVGEVAGEELDRGAALDRPDLEALEVLAATRREVVEHAHRPPGRDEGPHEVRADETRPAGHQHARHGGRLPARPGKDEPAGASSDGFVASRRVGSPAQLSLHPPEPGAAEDRTRKSRSRFGACGGAGVRGARGVGEVRRIRGAWGARAAAGRPPPSRQPGRRAPYERSEPAGAAGGLEAHHEWVARSPRRPWLPGGTIPTAAGASAAGARRLTWRVALQESSVVGSPSLARGAGGAPPTEREIRPARSRQTDRSRNRFLCR